MDQTLLERSLVNVTEKFGAYFSAAVNPGRQNVSISFPDMYFCETDDSYCQYCPAYCAANANLPGWRCIGRSFEKAVRYLRH